VRNHTLLGLFSLALLALRIVSNSEEYGRVADGWPLAGVPIAGCLGDQMAATLGQRCKKGEVSVTRYCKPDVLLLRAGASALDPSSFCFGRLSSSSMARVSDGSHSWTAVKKGKVRLSLMLGKSLLRGGASALELSSFCFGSVE
jgi:hypothetical protein